MNPTKCLSLCKTQVWALTQRSWNGSLMLSTPARHREWGWGWRSVVRLLRITVASFGLYRMTAPAQRFSLLSRSTPRNPMAEAKAIVFVVDDDLSVREALGSLIRSAGLKVETFASAQEFLARRRADMPSCLVLDVR